MLAATFRRHPVAASVAVAILLAVILSVLMTALPLSTNMDHAMGHIALAVPALLLLVLAVKTWPTPRVRGALVGRIVLLVGLALFAGGLLIEATGAFGYRDYGDDTGLTNLHDIGVLIGPFAIALTIAGALISVLAPRGPAAE
jgi:hypothetical protein